MQVTKEALSRFLNGKPEWTFTDGLLLMGLVSMYRASGNEGYRKAVLDYMGKSVSGEGTILPTPSCMADLAACGKALFFAWDETGEKRYQKALDTVASQIKASPLPDTPAGLYAVMPFLAEYDTRFGGKQAYKAIAEQFKTVHKKLFDPETGLYRLENGLFSVQDEGFMLMALADTAEKLDIQIYEHYRVVADMLFDAVRLPYKLKTDRLFILPNGDTKQAPDSSGGFMIVCAMFKGVRHQMLDTEKYRFLACQLTSELMARCNTKACDPGVGLLVQSEFKEEIRP